MHTHTHTHTHTWGDYPPPSIHPTPPTPPPPDRPQLFWLERPLYVHERSNRYYGPSAYFLAKIFSDLIPLRVIPPILLAATTQLLVGLRGGMHFFTYNLVLVMMTCIAATLNLVIGMLTRSIMAGILVATIITIHLILLTTIFVNFDEMKLGFFRGLRYLSFFNYGYEALVVNELAGRTITDFTVRLFFMRACLLAFWGV